MTNEAIIEKVSLDSLIYFCFGFTLEDEFGLILDKIVEKAYSDATNQGAFNTRADSKLAFLAKYEKGGSLDIIKKYIGELLEGNVLDFESWHIKTCGALVERYNDCGLENFFTYGNAQKWVNMALKYLYILSGISEPNEGESFKKILAIRNYATKLHIPIDSYIIDILWKEGISTLPLKDGVKADRNKEYMVPSEYVKGWSNWNEDDYVSVKKETMKICGEVPIEWESYAWIRRSKERKR